MSIRQDETNFQFQEKKSPTLFFNLEELLNRGFYTDALDDRRLAEITHSSGRHLEMLVYKIRSLTGPQVSRDANYKWRDAEHYRKMLAESPVGYVIHERLPDFSIDDVLYRFDIIQGEDGVALRILQDVAGTVKERKKKYLERYMGLIAEDQEKETTDLLRELLGNLRKDLQSDIIAAIDKATSPEKETASQRQAEKPSNGPQQQKELKIPSFYDSIMFMGMLSQRCSCRLHPELGLLILL